MLLPSKGEPFGFIRRRLFFCETERFRELLYLRLKDDLTPQQVSAVKRILEIVDRELLDPNIQYQQPVVQTAEETAESKRIQAGHEDVQRDAGTRK